MKKRLLSLVLCLVMVFSLLPMGSLAVDRYTEGYVAITNPTEWTPSSDYNGTNYGGDTSDVYALYHGEYYPVKFETGTLYEDQGAGWKAHTAAQIGATTSASTSSVFYKAGTNDYQRVTVSKQTWYANAGDSVRIYGNFTYNTYVGIGYVAESYAENANTPSGPHSKGDKFYTYSNNADGTPFWHVVYSNSTGTTGAYRVTLFYFTNNETGSLAGSGINYSNRWSQTKPSCTIMGLGENRYGWAWGGEELTTGDLEPYYTHGDLYFKQGTSTEFNQLRVGNSGNLLAWPEPGSNKSTTYSGHLYKQVQNAKMKMYIDVPGEGKVYPLTDGVACVATEMTDLLFRGTLYYHSKHVQLEPVDPQEIVTTTETGDDGVYVSKKLTPNGENYDANLYAYTTGSQVTTSTHTVTPAVSPMDIVLVVDQSASMATKDMGDDYAVAEMPAGGWTVAAATGGVTHYVKVGVNYYPVQAENDYVYELQENADIAASDEIGWGDDGVSLGVNGAPTYYNVDTDYYVYYNGEMHKLFLITAGLFGNYGLYPYIYTNNNDSFVKADKWEAHNYWVAVFDPWDGSDLRDNKTWNTLATANPARISFVNADGQAIGSADSDADAVKQTYSWFRDSATSGLTGTGIPMNGLYQLSRTKAAAKLFYVDASGEKHYIGNSAVFPDSVVYQNDDDNIGPLYVGNSTSRVAALQSAVTDFANKVRANAEENGVDHRMAVVGFAQNRVPNYSNTVNTDGPTTVGSNGKLDYSNTGIFTSNGSGGYTFKNYEVITGYARTNDHYINRHYFYNNEPYTFAGDYWKPIDGSGDTFTNYDSRVGGSNWKQSVYQTETGTSLTEADYQNAMVSVNTAGNTLNGQISYAIDNFATYGGSYTSYGMTMAEKLFQYADDSQAKNSEGELTQRERVIVVFTDGEPGETSFESAIAGEALVSANNMKTADHSATVYTVGLYKNAVDSRTSNFMSKLSSEYTNTLSPVYGGADNSTKNGLGQLDPSKTYYYVGDGGKYFALTTEYGDSDSLGWWVHKGSHTGTTGSYSQVTPKTSTGAGSTVFYNASGSEVQGDNVKTGTTYYTANHDKIVYEYRWYDSNHSVKNPVINGADDGLDKRVQFYELTAETPNADGESYYMTAANASELNGIFNKIIKMQIKDTVTVTSGTQYTDETLYVMDEISAGFDKTAATVVNVYADPATFDADGNLTGFTESSTPLRQGTRHDIEEGNADVSVTWEGKKVSVDYFDWGRKYVQATNTNAARIRVVITNLAPNTVGNASVTSDLDPYSDSESGNALWALPSNTAQSGLYLTERDASGNKLSSTLVEAFKVPSAPVPGYTVTWVDEDGTVLDSKQDLLPGTAVAYGGPTPAKASDDDYHYTFKGFTGNGQMYNAVLDDAGNIAGFDPAFPNMGNADVTYTAVYESKRIEKYNVTWMMPNGYQMNGEQQLEFDENVVSGTMPEYNGELPAIANNGEYTYFFAGWSTSNFEPSEDKTAVQNAVEALEPVSADVTYYAVFGMSKIPTRDYVLDYGVKNVLDTEVSSYDVIYQPGGEFGLESGNFFFAPMMNALGKFQSFAYTRTREFKVMDLTGMSQVNTAIYTKNDNYTKVNVIAASSIYLDDSAKQLATNTGYDLLTQKDAAYQDLLNKADIGKDAADTAKVDSAQPIAFTFTGTGIEVYAKTDDDSGSLSAYLLDKNGARYNVAGQSQGVRDISSKDVTLYNVPVVKYHDLPRDTYTLVILPATNGDFQFDGVRVFNANTTQQAQFQNVRESLLTSNPLVDDQGNPIEAAFAEGAVYLIGNAATTDVAEYKKNGPKNEVYLSAGESVAFVVPAGSNFRIGLSAVDGTPVNVKFTKDEKVEATTISNAIHMFYDITPYTDGDGNQMFLIKNVSGGVLSVTDLQYDAAKLGMFKFSRSLMSYAQSFDERTVVEPEVIEPGVEETPAPATEPTPTPTPDTPADPTPTPSISNWLSQLFSNFVSSLFGSIARLFGGH